MCSARAKGGDWGFSLRLALGVGLVFAIAAFALLLISGALLTRALIREDGLLVTDRSEDVRLAWVDGGGAAVGALLKDLESTTGEQLAVRIEGADGATLFSGATSSAPEVPWVALVSGARNGAARYVTAGEWAAISVRLETGETIRTARHSAVIVEVAEAYRRLFLTTVLPLLAAGTALGAALVFFSLNPLRRTVGVMRDIVRTGDWKTRVDVPQGRGEMQDLAQTFNQMLDRQQRLVQGMQQSLDNVAHDLRTPLTHLQSSLELALRSPRPEAVVQEQLADALEEVQRLRSTLDTLLDVAEAEAGAVRLQLETLSAERLLGEVAELYEYAAEDRGVRIEVVCTPGLTVRGDAIRLRRALANLVDNALKYLGSGTQVRLEAEGGDRHVVLSVQDDGPGIMPADLPRIWDRLFRGDPSRSTPGLGLGLSLVRAIAEAHKGSAEVESAPGQGSCFRLRLPR